MDWTTEHDMFFCREVIGFDLYQYKPGSKEKGQCLDRTVESLNSTEEPWLRVDQRSLRDRIKKLTKLYVEKRSKAMQASRVEIERTELDDLPLDIHERVEVEAAEASEANNKKLDKERQEAEERNSTVIDGAFIRKLRREEVP